MLKDLFKKTIFPDDTKSAFTAQLLKENFHRSIILGYAVMLFESILITINLISYFGHVDTSYDFITYLLMYISMFTVNMLFVVMTKKVFLKIKWTESSMKMMSGFQLGYVFFMIGWGMAITMLDQRLYGQITTFVVNVAVCAITFYMSGIKSFFIYIGALIGLVTGLPFFQSNTNILIGHYVNISVFCFLAWIVCRMLYVNFHKNFTVNRELEKTNIVLQTQYELNAMINKKLYELNKKLADLSIKDELTGLDNRRGLNEFLDNLLKTNTGKSIDLSAIMIDIDFFKLYNDNYGHLKGDEVLKKIAGVIKTIVENNSDFTVRFGGEEFLIISYNTDRQNFIKTADRIKQAVYDLGIVHQYSPIGKYVTVSLGVAFSRITVPQDINHLIEKADNALYVSKNDGRNKVTVVGG